MNLEDIYLNSPSFIQNLFLNVKAFQIKRRRLGKKFKKYFFHYLYNSDYKKVDLKQLIFFLNSANKTNFWNAKFKKYNVDIKNTENILNEIKKLPILTKQEVKRNYEDIVNYKITEDYSIIKTSGTTGSGLSFPQTFSMEQKQWAIWWRFRCWNGIELNTWMGWFGGRSILNINYNKGKYWKYNYPMKQVMFSMHHLSSSTIHLYYNEIKKNRLKWLHGYPSQLYFLAKLIKNKKFGKLKDLKIISVGGENLLAHQKKIIELVFGVKVIEHYGLAEGVVNLSKLKNDDFVQDQDFCYSEFIPFDNNNIYKLIGTNYSNIAFPLIRYDTGDTVRLDKDTNKILSVDGRIEDYVILPNGVKLGRLDHIFKSIVNVMESQIYQPDEKNIIIKIVKDKGYDMNVDEKIILSESKKKIGEQINIKLDYVKKIDKTSGNKLRFVISDL